MKGLDFEKYFDKQVDSCRKVLVRKAGEYAEDDDRLHNFKVAAKLQGVRPVTALAGMMGKHTVSVYDLIRRYENGEVPSMKMWEEKIGDSINYLFLLGAMIEDLYINGNEGCGSVNNSADNPSFPSLREPEKR